MLFNFRFFNRIFYAMFLLALIMVVGTLGFMLIEDEFSLLDAFYMTIITVSTVGFNEVGELSDNGRLFTVFLIITSFGTFAYALTSITSYLVGGEYRQYFKEQRMVKNLDKISDHVIVCGYGRVGTQAVSQLLAFNKKFVVIEQDQAIIDKFESEKKFPYLKGNAIKDEDLMKAGIEKASAIITTLPSDSDNLFVVLTARETNKKLTIISRASRPSSVRKLKIAGANNVIMPDSLGGSHMASLVVTPDVIEFLDNISIQGESDVTLEAISFDNLPAESKYKTIADLNAKYRTGCNIIGFKDPSGSYIINPDERTEIVPSSTLIVLGKPEQITELNSVFGIQ
ncbi:MAG TPA: potassium channel protein [Flavobacteriales bacterium]|nr:potassium channel protein [Crocinitomicaceae bacterium]HAE31815.1 potassium channel protein [Flavobacteriales bacterium]